MAKKPLITKKKQRWAKQFKTSKAMRGTPLNNNAAIQGKYVKSMTGLVDKVIKETEREVMAILKSPAAKGYFATDESISSSVRINMNKLARFTKKLLGGKSKAMADGMLKALDRNSKSNLHKSLKELSGGLSIKTDLGSADIQDVFNASLDANVDLIKTIPQNYIEQVRGALDRSIQNGGGLESLIPDIEKLLSKESKKLRNKAKNVALDQARKAYAALNAARMKKIGVKKYEWVHTGGSQEPREHHLKPFPAGLNGGIFSLDEPPVIDEKTGERGMPGTAINCKCVMRPIIEFDEGEQQ
tara:strand:- start:2994 stop:3893 length:900 start_codon:yes stop_codon:yes gene_type:complete